MTQPRDYGKCWSAYSAQEESDLSRQTSRHPTDRLLDLVRGETARPAASTVPFMPACPPSVRWRTVRVDGEGIVLMEAGDGDPLLFLHGWGLTPRAYADAVVRLCGAGVRILAPALPGFGGSTRLELGAGMAQYAARVARLIDVLDTEMPCFVVGHSFGGGVAVRLGYDRPDLVRSLTLVNAVGGAEPGAAWRPWSWVRWTRGALTELDPRNWLAPTITTRVLADLLPALVLRPLHTTSCGLVALTASLADHAQAVVDAGMPVVFIWGTGDHLITPGRFSDVTLPLAPDLVVGNHGWMLTQPDQFAAAVRDGLVVHALLERARRGQPPPPTGTSFPAACPPERRRRARHTPVVDGLLAATATSQPGR
jgi:pimeloyl-ACP methyl ester carboxylesterase